MEQGAKKRNRISRRTFLKGVPVGILGALAIGFFGSKMLASSANRRFPRFKKGSIFTPRGKDI
jgi:hypothetical protein